MSYEKPITYGTGVDGAMSPQLQMFYYYKKALIDAAKEAYFGQLANVRAMPKHYGKEIQQYHYIPLLDDRNINDQGIDATGASATNEVTITMMAADGQVHRAVGNGTDAGTALTAAQARAFELLAQINATAANSYGAAKTALEDAGWKFVESAAVPSFGNLWGSSKDIGYISSRLPVIGEQGGRVNRVGFTRITLKGSIERYGFFEEYTKDALDFDTDSELLSHITRESVRGANEIVEGLIQQDLLGGAGVIMYGGTATSEATITGETGGTASELTYDMLVKAKITLDDNRCPTNTEVISGSRMTDTKTVAKARYCYIGSALESTLYKMKDYHGEQAFIPVQMYADAGNVAKGEIGAIANFRFIVVPEMYHWAGVGATVSNNAGYRSQDGKYNVYPCLVVGSGSFATIGFQTDGNNVKFEFIHKKPSPETASREEPYGLTGFYSIKWWYGTMILRPEWIACLKVVAPL